MRQHLRVSGISLEFSSQRGPLKVLENVSFSVERGERVALLGASGSGKSTLLRVIDGLQRLAGAGGGFVEIEGETMQDGTGFSPRARVLRRDIAFVFQQCQLAPRLGLLTNVLAGALPRQPVWRRLAMRFDSAERARALDALARVGLSDQAHQRVSTLSGGQQQRGAIARALVQDGCIVLADEPVASLDPRTAQQVLQLLTELCMEDGRTLLVSLHQVAFARQYFPRAIALRAGQVVYDGPTAALDDDALGELYRRADEYVEAAG